MSRTLKRKLVLEGESPSGASLMGQVMFLDISDDSAYRPPSDVNETPSGVVIRMEIPGVTRNDVEVRVCGQRIEVCGEKRADTAGGNASYLCLERSFGKFHRAFEVSGPVNLFGMTAVLKGGVLVLAIPKCEERRGREQRIPVRAEEET